MPCLILLAFSWALDFLCVISWIMEFFGVCQKITDKRCFKKMTAFPLHKHWKKREELGWLFSFFLCDFCWRFLICCSAKLGNILPCATKNIKTRGSVSVPQKVQNTVVVPVPLVCPKKVQTTAVVSVPQKSSKKPWLPLCAPKNFRKKQTFWKRLPKFRKTKSSLEVFVLVRVLELVCFWPPKNH